MFGHNPPVHRFDELFGSTVKDSLFFLDVSNNSIQQVECLPRRAKIMLSHNNCPLNFSHRVLAQAGIKNSKPVGTGTLQDRSRVLGRFWGEPGSRSNCEDSSIIDPA